MRAALIAHGLPEGFHVLRQSCDHQLLPFQLPVTAAADSLTHVHLSCPICMEEIHDQVSLDCCDHTFCAVCIKPWCELVNTCPCCRKEISGITSATGTEPIRAPETMMDDEAHDQLLEQLRTEARRERAEARRVCNEAAAGARVVNGETIRPSPDAPDRDARTQRRDDLRAQSANGVQNNPPSPSFRSRGALSPSFAFPDGVPDDVTDDEMPGDTAALLATSGIGSSGEDNRSRGALSPSFAFPDGVHDDVAPCGCLKVGCQDCGLFPMKNQLKWRLDDLPMPSQSLAVSKEVYDAARADPCTLFVRTEEEARRFEESLMDTVGSISREHRRAIEANAPIDWHKTNYNADSLMNRDGFKRVSKPTITCIYHEQTADAQQWYELTHVYVPSNALDSAEMRAARDALLTAADARFELSNTTDAPPTATRKKPNDVLGEFHVKERGSKSMEGTMLMYGSHRRRSSGPAEEVEGCARTWPARYNPSGKRTATAAIDTVHEHERSLTRLEEVMLPEAAQTRSSLAERHDPEAAYRVIEGDPNSTAFSLSLSTGYVVGPHDDSGKALETIGFAYASDTPLPEGHAWEFAVAGCVHPLPKTRAEFALIAVRGEGVAHGTLPTSGTEPHYADHAGVGSALVSKKEMVDALCQQQQPGALPAPTEEQLVARRKEVAAVKKAGGDSSSVLEEAMAQREEADKAIKAALDAAAAAAATSSNGSLRQQLEDAQARLGEAAVDAVVQAGPERQRRREIMDGPAPEQLGPQPTWKESLLQKLACDEVPVTAPQDAPKSVCKALNTFTEEHGDGCLIFATTPETYDALGVPDVSKRAGAGWLVHELIRRVPEAEKEVKLNLISPGGSTKYTWCVLSLEGRRALVTAAQETTVGELDSAVRVRSEQSIRKSAMEQLAAQGLHECPTCYSPILDPNDPQYNEKDALIQSIGKRGAVLSRCGCAHGVGLSK